MGRVGRVDVPAVVRASLPRRFLRGRDGAHPPLPPGHRQDLLAEPGPREGRLFRRRRRGGVRHFRWRCARRGDVEVERRPPPGRSRPRPPPRRDAAPPKSQSQSSRSGDMVDDEASHAPGTARSSAPRSPPSAAAATATTTGREAVEPCDEGGAGRDRGGHRLPGDHTLLQLRRRLAPVVAGGGGERHLPPPRARSSTAGEGGGAGGGGVRRLFRGVQTMFMGCVPAHALYFSSY